MAWTKYRSIKVWLVGCLGSEVRSALWRMGDMERLGEAAVPGGEECEPCPNFASNSVALPYSWGKSRKTPVRVAEGCSVDQRRTLFVCRLDLRGRWPRMPWCALPPLLSRQATGSSLGQLKYLPSSRTRWFPISAKLSQSFCHGSNVVGREQNRKSSCVWLLITYRRTQVARQRKWIVTPVTSKHGNRQQKSTKGMHSPSDGGWVAYIAGLVHDE